MFVFWKIWHALFSCNTCFEIRPLALLPTNYTIFLNTRPLKRQCPDAEALLNGVNPYTRVQNKSFNSKQFFCLFL